MSIEIVLDGGEVIEVDAGPDDLGKYVADHYLATTQSKAWNRRKAIASSVIDELQTDYRASYEGPIGTLLCTKRNPAWGVKVDPAKVAEFELTNDDYLRLIANSKGFNLEAIDPGLRGSKPDKWKPTTTLGDLLKIVAETAPVRAGYIFVEAATQLAEDH